MATFYSQTYGNRYMQLDIWEIRNEPANNRTLIGWSVTIKGNNGYHWNSSSVYLAIDNVPLLNTPWRGQPVGVFPETDVWPENYRSGEMWIYHYANGTRPDVPVIFNTAINWSAQQEHGGHFGVSNIDRSGPAVTAGNPANIGINSFTISASSNVTCDQWAYRIRKASDSYNPPDGGWVFANDEGTGHTFTISGLTVNTDYVVQLAGKKKSNQVWTWAAEKSVKTLGFSQITSATNVTLDPNASVASTIKWTPLDRTFKFRIKLSIGAWSYTSGYLTPGSTSEQTWNQAVLPMEAIARECTTSVNATITATLYTYKSDNTEIGSAQKTFTAAIPASVKPAITAALATTSSAFNVYVKMASAVKAEVEVLTACGATLETLKMEVEGIEGQVYGLTPHAGGRYTATIYSEYFKTAGTVPVKITAADSRGRQTVTTQNITVYDYYYPVMEAHVRTSGTTVTVEYKAKIAPVNNLNNKEYEITLENTATGIVQTRTGTLPDYSGTWTAVFTDPDASQETFIARVWISDSVRSDWIERKTGAILLSGLPHAAGLTLFQTAENPGFWIRNVKHEIGESMCIRLAWELSEEWTQGVLYHAGQFVTHIDPRYLYMRNTDMTAPEAWNANDYTRVGFCINGEYSAAGDVKLEDLAREIVLWIHNARDKLNAIGDYIVSRSVVDGWEIEEYASGKKQLMKTKSEGRPALSQYGNGYYAGLTAALPSGVLSSVSRVQATVRSGQGLWNASVYAITASSISYYLYNMMATAGADVYTDLCVIGS